MGIVLAAVCIVSLYGPSQALGESRPDQPTNTNEKAEALWQAGIYAFRDGQNETALGKFNASLSIYQGAGNKQSELDVLTWIAGLKNRMGDFYGAVDSLTKAITISKEAGISPSKYARFKDLQRTREGMTLWIEGEDARKAGNKYLADKKTTRSVIMLYRDDPDYSPMNEFQLVLDGVLEGLIGSDFDDAQDYLRMARKIYDDLPRNDNIDFARLEKKLKALEYHIIGKRYLQEGNFDSAADNYQKAFQHYKDLNEKEPFAMLCTEMGIMYDSYYHKHLKDFDKAIGYHEQSIALYKDLGMDDMIPVIQNALYMLKGFRMQQMGDLVAAEGYYRESLKIAEKQNDPKSKVTAYHGLISVYVTKMEFSEAIDLYKQIIEIETAIGKTQGELNNLAAIASLYYAASNFKQALDYYKMALILAEKINAAKKRIEILQNIAETLFVMGDYNNAFSYMEEGIKVARKNGDRTGEAKGYLKRGKLYSEIGDHETAIKDASRFLELAARCEYDKADSNKSTLDEYDYYNSSRIYRTASQWMGEKDYQKLLNQALDCIAKAVSKAKLKNNFIAIGSFFAEGAIIAQMAGNKKEAIASLEAVSQLLNKFKDTSIEMDYYLVGSSLYQKWEDYTKSLIFAYEGLKVANQLKAVYWQIPLLSHISFAYFQTGNHRQALETLQGALRLAENIGINPYRISGIRADIGHVYMLTKDYENARSVLSSVIETIEKEARNFERIELKDSFRSNPEHIFCYENMLKTLYELGEDGEALEYAERGKSRTFLDILGNRLLLSKEQDKTTSEKERNLRSKINYLLEKIEKEQYLTQDLQNYSVNNWKKELEDLKREYSDLLVQTKLKNPELHSLISVNPLTVIEIQKLLNIDTTLLEYFVTKEEVFIWVLDKSSCKMIKIPIDDLELISRINRFREKVRTLQPDYQDDAKSLYNLLFEPAQPYIKTKRIGIVPHSVLHYLPFHALLMPGDKVRREKDLFLIEEYDIFYLPSASVLRFVLEKRKNISGDVLAVGNPDIGDNKLSLPYAEDEIRHIKRSFPLTKTYVDKEAQKDTIIKISPNYNIIHFATHGELYPASPLFSNLRLAKGKEDDGRLTVLEIFNLDLNNATLVTLSACETGLGKITTGDDLVGFTRGFIYAGTPSVVASLWKVNDESTSKMMNLFYKNLKSNKKVEALRSSQIEMIRGKTGKGIVRGVGGITGPKGKKEDLKQQTTVVDGSHPYFWAPFVLFGDWQ
jgi:CHAT domain-containing protein